MFKDITNLNSITESEFISLVNQELNQSLDKERKLQEIQEHLNKLTTTAGSLLLTFKLKFIFNAGSNTNDKLTVSEVANEYKVSNKTVLNWIHNKGLIAEQVIDDYYILRSDLKNWINKKAWEIPRLKVLPTKKAFFFCYN